MARGHRTGLGFAVATALALVSGCVEPTQAGPAQTPEQILENKNCGENFKPVQGLGGGVHPKDVDPDGYPRQFDEEKDPLCAGSKPIR